MIAKKVLLIGSFGVGKTSLVRRFVLNEFSENYISTIGVRISTKTVVIEDEEVKLMIWDVAVTSKEENVPKAYFLGSSAAMYVFDLSREETYLNLDKEIESIKNLSGLDEVIIVGNKRDLLSDDEIFEIRKIVPVTIDFITSAKENANVEGSFNLLTQQSLK